MVKPFFKFSFNVFYRLLLAGEVLGFENLVFSIFEFVHTLLENNKFKGTVKKALPELIYYIILYMQITEDQVRAEVQLVGGVSVNIRAVAAGSGPDCCPSPLVAADQSVDSKPPAVC